MVDGERERRLFDLFDLLRFTFLLLPPRTAFLRMALPNLRNIVSTAYYPFLLVTDTALGVSLHRSVLHSKNESILVQHSSSS